MKKIIPARHELRGGCLRKKTMLEYRHIDALRGTTMKDKVSRVLIASFLLVAAAMPFGAALAQTTEGLQIKPAVVEDKATRGEFYRFNLTVNNIASVDKTFYFSTQDITGHGRIDSILAL